MSTKTLSIAAAIMALFFIGTSCSNKQKSTEETATTEQTSGTMEIDDLLTNAESLTDQEVTIEGVCTHACKHGATKIFLMGSDDTQTIRVEAAKLGSFDTKCVNSIVRVTGTLKEQRVDEAYLQQWEARLKAAAAEKHGEGEAGCTTEKKARGETANTPQTSAPRSPNVRLKLENPICLSTLWKPQAMKFSKTGTALRKWSRLIHRDLSFVFSGMVLIYAISGIVMNHRNTINPNYSVVRQEYSITETMPPQAGMKKNDVLKLLAPLGEEKNYTKHYFPKEDQMKVFLKGGSNLMVNLSTKQAVYEKLTRRPLISALTKLHYNPGRWWTHFADVFAVGLIIITVTGLVMVKGPKSLWGRGGIELVAGILIPILFLFL